MSKWPSRQSVMQFALYNLGGFAFFVSGYAVFSLLYGLLSWQWWLAKIIADLTGWSINYLIQRLVAFRHESKAHKESALLARFSIISIINVPIDYAIVGGLRLLGITPFIGLIVSAAFFTVWKFAWYKLWVFKKPNT